MLLLAIVTVYSLVEGQVFVQLLWKDFYDSVLWISKERELQFSADMSDKYRDNLL